MKKMKEVLFYVEKMETTGTDIYHSVYSGIYCRSHLYDGKKRGFDLWNRVYGQLYNKPY